LQISRKRAEYSVSLRLGLLLPSRRVSKLFNADFRFPILSDSKSREYVLANLRNCSKFIGSGLSLSTVVAALVDTVAVEVLAGFFFEEALRTDLAAALLSSCILSHTSSTVLIFNGMMAYIYCKIFKYGRK
jgi:hypothetical protein